MSVITKSVGVSNATAGAALEAELAEAQRLAANPQFFPLLAAIGLRDDRPWGFGHVRFGGPRYWPAVDGDSAFILACEHGPRLLDLVACRMSDRRTATRTGDGHVLGRVWIDRARARGERLLVHSDPLAWLQRGAVGVVILDPAKALPLFKGVPALLCDNETLAATMQGGLAPLGIFPNVEFV